MKIILKIIFILSLISVPLNSYCSYMSDIENARTELSNLSEEEPRFQKILLLMDMIKDTKDSAKQKQLKILLEVELLALMDHYLYKIELKEFDLAGQFRAIEDASSVERADYWGTIILESKEKLEELRLEHDKIKLLLKHSI